MQRATSMSFRAVSFRAAGAAANRVFDRRSPAFSRVPRSGHRRCVAAPVLAGAVCLALTASAGAGACADGAAGQPVRIRDVRVNGSAEMVPAEGPVLRLAGLVILPDESAAAADRIRHLAAGAPLRATYLGPPDRHGRQPVRIGDPDAADLAAVLLESGLAVLTGELDPGPCTTALQAAEAAARAARRGVWAGGNVGPFSAADPELAARAGRFAIVEGTVLSTGQTSRTRFLNFGRHWTLDFTVTISESDRQDFVTAGVDPATLTGTRVRVRGWLLSRDGGAMRLSRPGQIERLGMSE